MSWRTDPLAWLDEADAERERNPFEPDPPVWQPPKHEPAMTMQEWREVRIQDGVCPLPGCSGSLDQDFFCAQCGQVSLPHQPVELQPDETAEALPPEYVQGTVDEYAPADVEAA